MMLKNKKPLLVTESNKELKSFCRKYNSGLHYKSAEEAAECIYYMLRHDKETSVIGKNGCKALADII